MDFLDKNIHIMFQTTFTNVPKRWCAVRINYYFCGTKQKEYLCTIFNNSTPSDCLLCPTFS